MQLLLFPYEQKEYERFFWQESLLKNIKKSKMITSNSYRFKKYFLNFTKLGGHFENSGLKDLVFRILTSDQVSY